MRSSLALGLVVLSRTLAAPTPDADPIRVLPSSWTWNITALEGPGCPDFGAVSNTTYNTRLTYGENTMDGSEIYYWHIAYPYLRATVAGNAEDEPYSWCETTVQYLETVKYDNPAPVQKPGYRLRLHKNGTRIGATYALENGVEAKWTSTYYLPDNDEVTDVITVKGPYNPGKYETWFNSPVNKGIEVWKMPQCGTGVVKYRTELRLSAANDQARGTVQSETNAIDGVTQYYGVQQGWSYDWEKCA